MQPVRLGICWVDDGWWSPIMGEQRPGLRLLACCPCWCHEAEAPLRSRCSQSQPPKLSAPPGVGPAPNLA